MNGIPEVFEGKSEIDTINKSYEYLNYLPGAILIQENGKIVYSNNEAMKILRCSNEYIMGKSLASLLYSEDGMLVNKTITEGEYKFKDFQSNIIDLDIRYNNEEVDGCFLEFFTLRDITAERAELSTIRENAEIYRGIFDHLPVSMFVTVNGLFEEVNKEGLRLLGEEDIGEIRGKNLLLYSHPEDTEFIKNRKNILYNKKQSAGFEEQRIIRKNGEILNIESASFPFSIKGHGAVVTTIRDITKRKKLETELNQSKELYQRLIDILPDGICIHDGITYSFVSDSYAKILGYDDPKDLVGKSLEQVVNKENHETMKQRMETLLSEDKISPRIEYKFATKQGGIKEVESTSVRFWHNNKLSILSSIRDITDRKKMEESRLLLERAIEYDKLKTEFFSNMSHELRTPLNILLSSLQLIGMYTEREKSINIESIKRYISIMKQNCYRLLRLINNLLDITKIDSGFYELNMRNYDIVKIVEDITQSVAEYIRENGIEVVFDTNIEEKIIGCDADKIERVILNLLSNAVKFTKPGGRIEVNINDLNDSISISIKDTGSGIPRDKLDTVFDRFIQVDKSLSRRSEGTGIGLALVKSLVEMHGGSISVVSEYERYTQFDILLPVKVLSIEEKSNVCDANESIDLDDKRIERMSIEFSDIYL